ncbi:MAG TPA: TIGR03619 family F420-dependent LLM class oxidoreductase [Candidatus Deferrimicrobiaceae bacterium]|nr:TIGR03619 family F420-dependent LLM class oxidoreductase [Candidatus Deferrimicrobiaceae bacterium]
MKLGICLPHYGRPIEPSRLVQLASRAEEVGLDSIWVTDHVILPRDIALIYRSDMLDPLAVLPWLAGVTERIALGTSVIVLPYRSPLPVAKLLASVDVLSGGRLIVGVAVGWVEGEFEALGVPFRERGRRTDEAIELFRAVWTQEYPELKTASYNLAGLKASPMPLQKPRPPILVGGASDAAMRRAARLGDGWHASGMPPSTFRAGALAVANHWKDAKREGEPQLSLRIPILIDGIHRPAVDSALLGARHVLRGPLTSIVRELRQYQSAGCEHVALEVSYSTYPAILDTIDIIAEEVRPALQQRER